MDTTTSSATRRPITEAWAGIDVGHQRALIYGPRFGRLYLLSTGEARDASFQWLVGLNRATRSDGLPDPANRIVHDRAGLGGTTLPVVPTSLSIAHVFLRASRHLLSLRASALLVRRVARLIGTRAIAREADSSEIGRLVCAIESGARSGDCYARSLLTALLCLCAGRDCTLVVGVLSPTRKMHAWCSVGGDLPYEPSAEHYLYQPAWTLALSP